MPASAKVADQRPRVVSHVKQKIPQPPRTSGLILRRLLDPVREPRGKRSCAPGVECCQFYIALLLTGPADEAADYSRLPPLPSSDEEPDLFLARQINVGLRDFS